MSQRDTRPQKVKRKFRKWGELYKQFAIKWSHLDFSEEALLEQYLSESYGDVIISENNGYAVGKKWLNVTVAMWKEDISKGLLFKHELYKDPTLPDWWLDSVLKGMKYEIANNV